MMIDFRGRGAGKEFEEIVIERLATEHANGNGHFSRYGVSVAYMGSDKLIPISSLPDFEGDLPPNAHHVIFDCKVASGSGFDMSHYHPSNKSSRGKRRQLKHMRTRARVGSTCFFLIHLNSREMKNFSDPSETFAIKVDDSEFWKDFDAKVFTSVPRPVIREIGYPVRWNTISSRESKDRPDVLSVIHRMRKSMKSQRFLYNAWAD